MRMIRLPKRIGVVAAVACALLGFAATPAASAEHCLDMMDDPRPRWFERYTTESFPNPGGHIAGGIWVDHFSSHHGRTTYQVCARGVVVDLEPDGWGAAAYARYDKYDGTQWITITELVRRADGAGTTEDFHLPGHGDRTWHDITDFYMFVCRIKGDVRYDHCSWSNPA